MNVCVLDAAGFCRGCLRTGDEIARWGSMSAAEQWALIETLEARWKDCPADGCAERVRS